MNIISQLTTGQRRALLLGLFFISSFLGLIAAAPLVSALVEAARGFGLRDFARIFMGFGLLCLGQYFAQRAPHT